MTTDPDMAALCWRIWREPQWIQVCCPRGHFIKAVRLWALPLPPGAEMIIMFPAMGRRHGLTPLRPGQRPREGDDNGFTMRGEGPGGTVTLSCRRCPRWKPAVRDHQRLAAELAFSALAGHQQHRISS